MKARFKVDFEADGGYDMVDAIGCDAVGGGIRVDEEVVCPPSCVEFTEGGGRGT